MAASNPDFAILEIVHCSLSTLVTVYFFHANVKRERLPRYVNAVGSELADSRTDLSISGFNSRSKVKIINLKGDLILPIDRADKFSRSLLFSLFAYVIASRGYPTRR